MLSDSMEELLPVMELSENKQKKQKKNSNNRQYKKKQKTGGVLCNFSLI